jgi:hypothetical protein
MNTLWISRSHITPEAAPRRFRRALSAMARHNVRLSVTIKATERLLGCDPLTARDFLARCGGLVTARKRPRVVAFNFTPQVPVPEIEGESTEDLQARCAQARKASKNAAKAERRAK